jgi:formylglycine-generating enzyme required for sulfatase activity/Fe2+ transport system protein FeoA
MRAKLNIIISVAAVFLFVLTSCTGNRIEFSGKLVKPPVATRQLGPSIFFSKKNIADFGLTEGTPVRVYHDKKFIDLRPYLFFGDDNSFALHKKDAEKLGLQSGVNKIIIEKIDLSQTKLTPKPIKFHVENYKGNLEQWKGFAFGAPHGDCDNETGEVVKKVSARFGIPSTAAYGCRVSYRGIWYDCNRPLMKKPKENGHGVIPERQWNKAAEAKYKVFQDSVLSNSKMKYGDRFNLYCSFHGHDLTVKLKDGTVIQRPVIEGMGMGFSNNELRRIKKYYYRVRNKLYKNPPDLYFGNLPEDHIYEYQGIKLTFFYTGLGSRTYGSLRRDFLKNGLHFETPNSMRFGEDVQSQTAVLLSNIYSFVRDSIFTERNKIKPNYSLVKSPKDLGAKILIPKGDFLMGVKDGQGWSSERPQHTVFIDDFLIDKYEVTNYQFAEFLNSELNSGKIQIKNGVVSNINTGKILYRTKKKSPFSEISFTGSKFVVDSNRNYFPVIYVTYWGASEYAQYKGGRLPTEAEWEKAASWDAKHNRKYLYSVKQNTINGSMTNFDRSGDMFDFTQPGTTPVGYYRTASPYGVKDMSGNVWEWTADNYIYSIYKSVKDSVLKNPLVTKPSTMKTIRGGAWDTEYAVLRSSMRLGINPDQGLINLGFRCGYKSN